jgi:YaeC family lipoprotein
MNPKRLFPFALALLATNAFAAPVRIAASAGPQVEILDLVRQIGAQKGTLELEVVPVRDADRAHAELLAGRLDASSVDDGITLADRIAHGDRLVAATQTVTLPLGLYSRKLRDIGALRRGATVALPRAPHQLARALILLQNYGLIELRDEAGTRAKLADVVRNRRELRFLALPPSRLAAALPRADLVALDFDAAAKLGLAPARDAIGIEDGRSPYANVLSVRAADGKAAWLKDFVAIYRSNEVQRFILTRFEDSVRRPW